MVVVGIPMLIVLWNVPPVAGECGYFADAAGGHAHPEFDEIIHQLVHDTVMANHPVV